MRTKTLLLTAALAIGSVASSMAQVFSQNVVGYVNITVSNNAANPTLGYFVAAANPLNNGTNTLDEILPNAPANTTTVFQFVPATSAFVSYTKRANWGTTAAGVPFNPGTGFFVRNTGTAPITLTFVGEVPEGTKTTPIGAGFNLIASAFPLSGPVETGLGLPAVNGNLLYQWVPGVQNYVQYTRRTTAWTGGTGEPSVGVGEGFFFQAQAPTNWTKTYTVPRP